MTRPHFLLLTLLTFSLCCLSCTASPKKRNAELFASEKAAGYGEVLSDSIADILLNASRTSCILPTSKADTLRRDLARLLTAMSQGQGEYSNRRRHITYTLTPLSVEE